MPIRQEGGFWIGDRVKLEAFYQDLAAGETDKWLYELKVIPIYGRKHG